MIHTRIVKEEYLLKYNLDNIEDNWVKYNISLCDEFEVDKSVYWNA